MMKMFVLVATLALRLAASEGFKISEVDYVNNEARFGGRIIGGEVADIADLPYQIALLKNLANICGGSIIAAKTVLTVAHCVESSVISSLSELSIRAGSNKNDTGGSVIQVSGVLIHEGYVLPCWICPPKNDIALVFLAESAIGAGGVASVIPLADSVPVPGTSGVISGWGKVKQYGYSSPDLLRADVPIFDHAECQTLYTIDDAYVCAGYEKEQKERKGPCQGDSGGPYAINGQLVGIISFGYECGEPGLPAVYTSIPAFREWIEKNAGI